MKFDLKSISHFIVYNLSSTKYATVWHYPKYSDTTKLSKAVEDLLNRQDSQYLVGTGDDLYLVKQRPGSIGSRSK